MQDRERSGVAGRLMVLMRRKTPGISWWNEAQDGSGMGLDVTWDHPRPQDPDKRDLTPFAILGVHLTTLMCHLFF